MKKSFGMFFLLISAGISQAQVTLKDFELERIRYDKKSMLVLGGWSAANIVTGAFGTNTSNAQTRYFHQMNVIWNSTNLLIAGLGYWGASREKTDALTLTKVLKHQNAKEKTFLFNAGLDLVYISGGLYLTERSRRNTNPAKLKGYGNSVMLQGGFLLVFDAVMYTLHHQHGKKLAAFTDKITIAGGPGSIYIAYRF